MNLTSFKIKIYQVLKFLGRKTCIWFAFGCGFSFIIAIVEILITLFIQMFFISLGFIHSDLKIFNLFPVPKITPSDVVVFLFLIGILRFFAQFFSNQTNNIILENSNCRLRLLAASELIDLHPSQSGGAAEMSYKLSESFPKSSFFLFYLMQFLSLLIQSSFLIVMMIYISWKETVLGLFGIGLIGIALLKIHSKLKQESLKIPKVQASISVQVQKIAKNWLFLKIMNIGEQEKNTFRSDIMNYTMSCLRVASLGNLCMTLPPFLGIILLVFILLLSQTLWHTNSMILISFLYLFIRFVQYIGAMGVSTTNVNTYYPQFKESYQYFINHFMNQINEISNANKQNILGLNYSKDFIKTKILETKYNNISPPKIEITNLEFKYESSPKKIIDNYNLKIEAGEHLGIIGPSGSGKSTLLLLILGVLKPQKGSVLIDNMMPKDYFLNNSNKIGYVGPEPFLINGSIYENICYGINRTITKQEVEKAISFAKIADVSQKMGLDYVLDESQSGLSSGQKQRICIARAILNNPIVLIFDEASSNLDEATESDIAQSISELKQKCTVIIVSHRPGIIKYVDKTIDIKFLNNENTSIM